MVFNVLKKDFSILITNTVDDPNVYEISFHFDLYEQMDGEVDRDRIMATISNSLNTLEWWLYNQLPEEIKVTDLIYQNVRYTGKWGKYAPAKWDVGVCYIMEADGDVYPNPLDTD